MRGFSLNKKTGFRVKSSEPVIILDERLKLFYSTENFGNIKSFNLPPNFNFFVKSGNFTPLKLPIRNRILKNEKPDRNINKNPLNFNVVFKKNSALVTTNWIKETITFDNYFKNCSIPIFYFALFHEVGHKYWDKGLQAEKNCDVFAVNKMIKMGFNYSQCGGAIIHCLKEQSNERKLHIINKILEK